MIKKPDITVKYSFIKREKYPDKLCKKLKKYKYILNNKNKLYNNHPYYIIWALSNFFNAYHNINGQFSKTYIYGLTKSNHIIIPILSKDILYSIHNYLKLTIIADNLTYLIKIENYINDNIIDVVLFDIVHYSYIDYHNINANIDMPLLDSI